MKKSLSLLVLCIMVVSCISVFGISASAAVEFVEPSYTYGDAKADFATHYTQDSSLDEWQALVADEFLLGEQWTYEYWDSADEAFHPMTAYYPENHLEEAWSHWTWKDFYTANSESAWYENEYTYCSIGSTGSSMYPGTAAGSVITFIVPATGVISYEASLYCNSEHNTAAAMGEDNYGNYVSLWVNDKKVWPATEDESLIHYENASDKSPKEISLSAFNVTVGDRVRLLVTARNGNRSNKGTMLKNVPQITYHSASVPIGNPNGTAPENFSVNCPKNTLTAVVTWDAVQNAAGYNVYLKPDGAEEYTKVNPELITGTTFTIENLESESLYDLTITTVTASGNESDPSDPQFFKSRKVNTESEMSDTAADTDASVTDSVPASSGSTPAASSIPLWIIPVGAGVAIVAVILILLLALGRKKTKPSADVPKSE